MTDRETFRNLISQMQHEAEEALVRGDVGPRLQMWSHKDPVTLFAALGASKTGWDELEPTFHSVASRVSGGHAVTYEIVSFDLSGDLAWTVGFSRFTASIDGGPLTRYTLRVTHLYRREGGDWKVVHEHSDFQPGNHVIATRSSGTPGPEGSAVP
jgi:ketosteroid isomerase-like protein